jgi:hypothetical protein
MQTPKFLKIQIIEFTNKWTPRWVLSSFHDIEGTTHLFEQDVRAVTGEFLDGDSKFPKEGAIECQIVKEEGNVVTVDIMIPYVAVTRNGEHIFQVFANQISDTDFTRKQPEDCPR